MVNVERHVTGIPALELPGAGESGRSRGRHHGPAGDLGAAGDAPRTRSPGSCRSTIFVSVPVVDGQERLVGRVTIDDVVDVIEEEASKDIYAIAGVET